jgi:glycosyltransferase involved in cell wall biosynthesis
MPPFPQARDHLQSVLPGTDPQHLAFVTSTPYDVAGGSGTYVGIRELLRALDRRGIGTTRFGPHFWLPSYTLQRLVWNYTIARRLRKGRFDWVVGFDLDGFHYGRAPVAPYVASIKGVIADELTNEQGWVRMLLAVQAAFERLAVRRARVVVATSRYSRGRIVEAYGVAEDKILVVPELIDLDAWTAAPERREGLDPPPVLTVAHLYPRKNLGTLLRAYRVLAQAGVPFQGWIVGDGPCRAAWERLCAHLGLEKRVEFLGTVSRAELADRYRRAAVFCLPSRQEGFGIVFLEAMAHGLPIVAGRAGAVPETVAEGEVGLLADPGDPDELARCLAAVLEDPALRCRLGAAGRARAERFRADRVAGEFLAAVRGALAGGKGGVRP